MFIYPPQNKDKLAQLAWCMNQLKHALLVYLKAWNVLKAVTVASISAS